MSVVYTDLSTASYRTPGHPEAPERVLRVYERLKAAGHELSPPPAPATEADVLLAHEKGHFEDVRDGRFSDPDTPHHPGIERVALTAMAGALASAAAAARGRAAFSLMRPPGHHAGRRRVAGFCYFNNMAAACERLLSRGETARVAVVDVDVHHGDGTEEILHGRDGLLFCSLHQSPLYPGTGLTSRGNCLNVPLPAGTGEKDYLMALEGLLRSVEDFKPEVLAVSTGFDTYKECPIAELRLERTSYRRMAKMLAEACPKRFAILEGGYAPELPLLVETFLEAFFP